MYTMYCTVLYNMWYVPARRVANCTRYCSTVQDVVCTSTYTLLYCAVYLYRMWYVPARYVNHTYSTVSIKDVVYTGTVLFICTGCGMYRHYVLYTVL